ncbi:MAG: hypothetical protein EOO96_06040 [Pedobacter sp.]|nr:MAG: hypothetical protein EOO96_06040 [Pedobacter sp.]
MKENVEFKKIREFGDLIGDTMLFIKQNFKPLMKCFFSLCGIFILAGMISSIMAQLQMVSMLDNVRESAISRSYNNPFNVFYNFGINYLLVIIFLVLNYTSMYVTILSYISIYIQKGNVAPTLPEVWSYFKFYFWRMLGSGIVMTIFLMICFVCCFFPGVYVFPAVSLFYPIMIMENASFSYSFSRSFNLLKNEWWITAATFMVIWLITYACTLVIQLPGTIIAMVSAFSHLEQPVTKGYAIATSVSSYIAQIFLIIPIIGATFIYFNLVERKESSGLLNRIDGLGQNSQSTPTENIPEEY